MTLTSNMSAPIRHLRHPLRVCVGYSLKRFFSNRNILTLHDRGLLQNVFPDKSSPDLLRQLVASPQCMYCGFDPTADSLHVGNLLSIMVLLHCQRAGHHPIALIGGATGMIGDPSGRSKDRDAVSLEQVNHNVQSIHSSLERIFTNHERFLWKTNKSLPGVRILNNAEWYKNRNVIEFLSNVGRHFRMSDMLGRHSVKSRLNSSEGMCFTEFTYQIFQAYDWLHLYNNYGCLIQIGGGDQMGNILTGHDLIQRLKRKQAFGLTVPILTTASGQKLGKSLDNTVWLNDDKTSAFELYQYFLRRPDSDVESFLKWFTFFPDKEVDRIVKQHKLNPDSRGGQKKIAEQVTLLIHGEEGLKLAQKCSDILFSNSIDALSSATEQELLELFYSAPTFETFLDPGTTVLDAVMKTKHFNREVDADRVIRAGGIYINQQRSPQPEAVLIPGQHILPNGITVLRVGKKNYNIIKWVNAKRVAV